MNKKIYLLETGENPEGPWHSFGFVYSLAEALAFLETYEESEHKRYTELNLFTAGVLKQCPFCGGKARFDMHMPRFGDKSTPHFISCTSCGATGERASSLESAAEKWNTRHA